MNPSDDENTKAEIRELVRTLFRCENHPGDRATADKILADDYLPITRAKGQVDRNREETLDKIASSPASFHRDVDSADIDVALFQDNTMAIARSRLSTSDSAQQPPAIGSYRNMHVLLKRNNQWQCIAWQVTRIQEETGGT
jgi:hypothetical protein